MSDSGITKKEEDDFEIVQDPKVEEKQPLLSPSKDPEAGKSEDCEELTHSVLKSSRSASFRNSPRSQRTYGGGLSDEVFDDGDAEKGSFGCFQRCEKCGATTSEKCRACCGGCCHTCCCCDCKDMHLPRCCEDERITGTRSRLKLNKHGKIYEYDHEILLSWRVLMGWAGTIFMNRAVYIVVPYVLFLALLSFTACYVGIPSARKLDTGRFNDFVTYIKVFIAFMLGLFLNNAFKRWWSSVSHFKRFLVSIKQLIFTMQAVGVRLELHKEVERLTVCSAYVLNEEVHCAQIGSARERRDRWEESFNKLVDQGYLTVEERDDLEKQSRCLEGAQNTLGVMSTLIWIWVGESMGQVKLEPKVAPPMYVRLLFLCQDCLAQVELLKTNLIVQLPFTYVHMLCAMVHLANILLAISCGLTIGSAFAEVQSRHHALDTMDESSPEEEAGEYFLLLHFAQSVGTKVLGPSKSHVIKEMYTAIQMLGLQFVILLFQPLMYQSFLVIAHALCYPYGSGLCHMPTESFIQQIEYELQVMTVGGDAHRNRRRKILERKEG